MTTTRTTTLFALGLVLGACDPAKTGYYHGNYPDPVSISIPSDTDPARVAMKITNRRDTRRWIHPAWTVGIGGHQLTYLWSSLALELGSEGGFDLAESYTGSALVMGSVIGAPNYVYLVTQDYTDVEPTGPSGERLTVLPGFHVFRRSCTADNPNHFEEVPLDTALVYDPTAAANQEAGLDPYLEACGIHFAPTIDLGTRVGTLPPSNYGGSLPVSELAWAPASDVVYLLAGALSYDGVEILSYTLGAPQLAQVGFGDYHGPLEVANGGTSLLVTRIEVIWDSGYYTRKPGDRLRLSLVSSSLPAEIRLPFTSVPIELSPIGLLSPDGNTIATTTSDASFSPVIVLIDVKSGSIRNPRLASGTPFAWDPTGTKLLVENPSVTTSYQIVPVDGSPATELLGTRKDGSYFSPIFSIQGDRKDQVFWTATGPKVVMQGGYRMYPPGYDDSGEKVGGVSAYDLLTGTTTSFVEPTRQAPPSAPVGVAAATEQIFAWAIDCLGLGETSCTSELRRLSLATGAVDVVARADGPLPFAVSPDGTKLAFAYQDGIYLKTIQP